jgi:hypothetical protein
MTSFSGGLVYEFSEEPSDYGLVNITGDAVNLRPDYDNLQSQYNKLDVKLLESTTASKTSTTPPKCSPGLISNSGFSNDFSIPSAPSGAAGIIANGISNPNQGKLVDIKNLTPDLPIYGSDGKQLSISVKPVSNANTPNGTNTSASAGKGGSGKKSEASHQSTAVKALQGAFIACAAVAFCMFMA